MQPQRVRFFSRFGHKYSIDFGHFGLKQGMVFHFGLELGMYFRSYFFFIINKTVKKSLSQIMFMATLSGHK